MADRLPFDISVNEINAGSLIYSNSTQTEGQEIREVLGVILGEIRELRESQERLESDLNLLSNSLNFNSSSGD